MSVDKIGTQATSYLALDDLAANPRLARLLPADLARRFHALPLAEDKGRVTVVMADPEDAVARAAIAAALGTESCLVQGDAGTIDALLAQVWGNEATRPLKLMVCSHPEPVSARVWEYAQGIASLLGAELGCMDAISGMNDWVQVGDCGQSDLAILGQPDHALVRRLLSGNASESTSYPRRGTIPFAVVTARQPRWPLKKILLVLCGEDREDAATEWVLRLARHSNSAVTVLAVVPPVPAMHSRPPLAYGLPELLTAGSPLGRQMRRVARNLVDWEIEGTLRLRQGSPDGQICQEVVSGNYDLIAVTDKPCRWWLRWLEGDLIGHLLHWIDRPVLVAKPTTT
jgi:nucleotide-binding universal stress UspA family protein